MRGSYCLITPHSCFRDTLIYVEKSLHGMRIDSVMAYSARGQWLSFAIIVQQVMEGKANNLDL